MTVHYSTTSPLSLQLDWMIECHCRNNVESIYVSFRSSIYYLLSIYVLKCNKHYSYQQRDADAIAKKKAIDDAAAAATAAAHAATVEVIDVDVNVDVLEWYCGSSVLILCYI